MGLGHSGARLVVVVAVAELRRSGGVLVLTSVTSSFSSTLVGRVGAAWA